MAYHILSRVVPDSWLPEGRRRDRGHHPPRGQHHPHIVRVIGFIGDEFPSFYFGTAGGSIRVILAQSTRTNLQRAVFNGGLDSVPVTLTFGYTDGSTHTHTIVIPVDSAAFG